MAIPLFKLIVVYGTYEQTRTPFKGGLSSHICRVMAFTFFLCDTEKLNQWRYHLIRKNGEPGFIDSIVAINNVRKSYKILATEGTPPPNAWAPSKAAKFMATKGIIIDKYRLISGELWQGRYEKEFNEVHESYFIEGKENSIYRLSLSFTIHERSFSPKDTSTIESKIKHLVSNSSGQPCSDSMVNIDSILKIKAPT
ncbi:hypothetical protein [Thaumasiovibrio subtropicus]|uniref:hypothetical protein n=1 Tax=Thaumasiovibrio subtropicus TaxID=1891207 RepID=UPI001C85AD1B|nr:hypothetical protein [Thaumasiovibrio subtropicus]